MSNVKKPEPVAWHINKENRKEAFLTDLASDAEIHIALSERYKGISVVPLITSVQSETYKDACVREALEQAAKKPREYALQLDKNGWGNRFPDELTAIFNAADNMADRIRALIPKQ